MKKLLIVSIAFVLLPLGHMSTAEEQKTVFSDAEIAIIRSFGPWPPEIPKDESNRFSGNPEAIQLGAKLFFDTDISSPTGISCAGCHDPDLAFSDGVDRSTGLARIDRNSIALANLALNRWFSWSGRSDSLWAQSIHPILDSKEMGSSAENLKEALLARDDLLTAYNTLTATDLASDEPQEVLVNVAKFLASFQETIVTPRTEFDLFRDQLIGGSANKDYRYPESAKRGLKLFIGEGNCFVCHFGPNFTNGEFSNNALPHFIDGGRVDGGRYEGITKFRSEPYKRSGIFSDAESIDVQNLVDNVVLLPRNWGEFRVPSLRNVSNTAPYMHNGSLKTLEDVIRHYSNIDLERLHTDGENILKPLDLNDQEIFDLVSFLETLDGNPTHYQLAEH